jgi:cytochrome oxidase Cu insertion factor (SCO1/SenC/PrrC family)
LLAGIGLQLCGTVVKEVDMARLEIGSPAPDFTLKDCYDNTVSLSDLKGKKAVLYFYTSSGGGN